MNLTALFERCLTISYTQVENGADYAIERIGTTLFILSHQTGTWTGKATLIFPPSPINV